MSTDQPENELNDLTIARLKRNLRDFPIVATNGCIDGVVFGDACIREYEEAVMDENEVWSKASKIADERDAAKREVAQLKQRVSDLKFAMGDTTNWFDRAMVAERERDALRDEITSLKARLAGPLLKPCPTCRGDAVSCGSPGCPTCADSPVDGWVPA